MSDSPPPKRQKLSQSTHYSSFPIEPLSQFTGPCALIKQPVEVTCFSYDKHRNLLHDTSSMKYYYPAKLNADLEEGFDEFVKFGEIDEHLDSVLASLQRYEETQGKEVQVDIITWRGMMTKIMTRRFMEYERDTVQRYHVPTTHLRETRLTRGGSYIEEDIDFASRRAANRQHELAMFTGYKFEELSTLTKTWDESTRQEIESRTKAIVDNFQQYCSIVKTQLGSSTIVMGGEVDCLWGPRPLTIKLIVDYKPDLPENPVPHYVELKTSKELTNPRSIATFEQHKLLKFWAQSFLLGVPKIVVGFRSDRNTLASLQTLETMQIPAQVRERGTQMWDGNVCINFTAKFLEFVRETVVDEGSVYGIKFVKGGRQIDVVKQDGGKSFLTNEYVSWKSK